MIIWQFCVSSKSQNKVSSGRPTPSVIADPLAVFFTADSHAAVNLPLQPRAPERGGNPEGCTDAPGFDRVASTSNSMPMIGFFRTYLGNP